MCLQRSYQKNSTADVISQDWESWDHGKDFTELISARILAREADGTQIV